MATSLRPTAGCRGLTPDCGAIADLTAPYPVEPTRQILITGSLAWAVAGAIVALSQLPEVNADARWLVGVASVVFPGAAVLAAMALRRGALRWAGVFLVVSVATPTYYAYPLNIPALVAGLVLLAVPSIVDGSRRGSVTRPSNRLCRPN